MLSTLLLTKFLVYLASAHDAAIQLIPKCPGTILGEVMLELRSEVPAYALASCRNGHKDFITSNDVQHRLLASLDQHYIGHDCLFYKRYGVNTFTVDIEVGWGQAGSTLITKALMHTVTCSYDEQGKALSSGDYVADGYVNPGASKANIENVGTSPKFDLTLVDFLDKPIPTGKLTVGRKVRLQAIDTSNSMPAFRAVNCVAKSGDLRYNLLTEGCGDGIVFDKTAGFNTIGHSVYSPYFKAFKLQGADSIYFECNFTVCSSGCDGDSCLTQIRSRLNADSPKGKSMVDSYIVTAASNVILTDQLGDDSGAVQPDLHLSGLEEPRTLSKSGGIAIMRIMCILSPFLIASLIMGAYLCYSQPLSKKSSYNSRLTV